MRFRPPFRTRRRSQRRPAPSLFGAERLEARVVRAALTLEAETGTLTGVSRSTAVAGFSGTGYVTGFDQAGDRVTWSGFGAAPGPYRMVIRYRAQFGDKGFEGALNGVAFSGTLKGSTTFKTLDAGLVTLGASNTLHVGGGWNYYEIDAVTLTPEAPVLPKPVPGIPVNPAATPMAKALLARVVQGYSSVTLSGQNDTRDLATIQSASGKLPALVEGDFMDYSPSRVAYGANPGSLTENYIALAKDQGYMVSMAWHWNAPTKLVNSADYPWWRGFYTQGTTFDIAATLANPAGGDYQALLRDIDAIAVQLKKFAAADVPVLWRPLHESEGGWFWWGAKGPEAFKQLWRLTHDRLTNHHQINNLVWVLTSEDPAWYPGDDVVDVVGVDAYPSDRSDTLAARWSPLLARFDGVKPLALTEFGGVPDVDAMKQVGVTWAYFFSWNGSYGPSIETTEKVRRVYTSANVITKDENPALVPAAPPGVVTVAAGVTQVDSSVRTGSTPLVKRGAGTLVLAAGGSFSGGTVVEEGELVIRHPSALGTGALEVAAAARVRLDVGFDVVSLPELLLAQTGRIDLGTGRIMIAEGGFDAAAIRQLIVSGRNGGGWNGTSGIMSTAAPAGSQRAVGFRQSGGALTLAWAAFGDTNLDGRVGTTDISMIQGGGKYGGGGTDAVWSQGDFNYDGRVTTTDIGLFSGTGLWGGPSYRPVIPAVSIADATVTEPAPGSAATAIVPVTLAQATTNTVTLAWATVDGTATAGLDYAASSGTLTFNPGETSTTIAVPILADATAESGETFVVTIGSPSGATIADGSATVSIAPPPSATAAVDFVVTNSWTGNFSGQVTIRNNAAMAVDGWTLEFDLPATLTAGNLWGAEIVTTSGGRYRLKNASWTAAIPAGGSITFSFNAAGPATAQMTNKVFNGLSVA